MGAVGRALFEYLRKSIYDIVDSFLSMQIETFY